MATIVGIDINPECAAHAEDGINVRIGDQSDARFLGSLVEEFGAPDVVIDDGSHRMSDVLASFTFLYEKISKNGIYIVEDLHTAYWSEFGGGADSPDSFINISKNLVDQLNAVHSHGAIMPSFMTHNTFSISFYDSMVVFERGSFPLKHAPVTGGDIPRS